MWLSDSSLQIVSTTYQVESIPAVCTPHWHLCCPRSHHRWCPNCHWHTFPLFQMAWSNCQNHWLGAVFHLYMELWKCINSKESRDLLLVACYYNNIYSVKLLWMDISYSGDLSKICGLDLILHCMQFMPLWNADNQPCCRVTSVHYWDFSSQIFLSPWSFTHHKLLFCILCCNHHSQTADSL